MRILGRAIRILGAMLAVWLASSLVSAPAVAATTDLTACFRAVQKGDTIADIMVDGVGFACTTHQNSLPSGDYWVRFQVPKSAETAGRGMVFRTASLWDGGFQLWVIRADGAIKNYHTKRNIDINPMRLGATVVVPIDRRDQAIQTIYARVEDSAAMHGVMQQSQLSTTDDALYFEMLLAVCYAAFAGLSIALLVYNLALWRGMREPFLLAYCGMLLATLTYAVFTSGAPHYVWPKMTGPDRLQITIPLLAINAASAMIFIRHFFEASNIPNWLVKWTYAQSAFGVCFALFYSAVAPLFGKVLAAIFVFSFIPLPAIVLCYVIIAAKRRDPFLRYFLLAWAAPAVAVICRVLFGLDILPYHMLIENGTLIALAIEALISSLAIGYRVRLLGAARDRAEIAEANAMVIADTDALTGLPNRRAFVRKLLEEPRDWQLMLVDIDHFKRINDTLGHVEGDEVLVRLAEIIRSYANENSIVARLGGEEFAIATVIRPSGEGAVAASPLLDAIRRAAMPGGYRITASIGIARRAICEEMDWKILYRAADMALYRAKSDGRDRHVDYSAERIAA
jgi:diguanylate cyclase (GGDEF)-like protein